MKFDSKGNFIKAFGADMVVYPHGLHVLDQQGNIWIADLKIPMSISRRCAATPRLRMQPVNPKPSKARMF